MPAERSSAYPRPAGDLTHRDRQALGGERLERHLEYALPVALRVSAQRPRRLAHPHLPA